MLEGITLKNFKAFKSLDQLTLKPVTILCGTNSCGKSSILQSILLLKQTVESKNPNQTVLLNGRFVHLGAFENIIYEKNKNNEVQFKFRFRVKPLEIHPAKGGRQQMPFQFLLREVVADRKNMSTMVKAEHLISYDITLRTAPAESPQRYLGSIIVPHVCFSLETKLADGKTIPGTRIEMTLKENGLHEIEWRNIERYGDELPRDGSGEVSVAFANFFPTLINLPKDEGTSRRVHAATYAVYRISDIFEAMLSCFTYIGPLREEPSRRYIYEDEIVEIGIKGENAAYIYLSEQYDLIGPSHYFYSNNSDSFVKEDSSIKLNQALRQWLDLMEINDFKVEPVNEILYLNLDSSSSKKTRVNIADVGFGVSQIFPILLEGLRMPKGNTLLLEQPEIHLHPNLQMQMADYFLSLALSGKRVIVETHSDHIINRLVRRIVEDDHLNLEKLVGIYFIKPTAEGSIYEEIKVDDKVGINNWPENFFDQTALEQEKIIRAGLKKRQTSKKQESRQ